MNLGTIIIGFTILGISIITAPVVLLQDAHQHGHGEHDEMKQSETKMEGQDPQAGVTKKAPIYITSEELHSGGGVPKGWSFTVPPGDSKAGRQAFIDLECFKCHVVASEDFPDVTRGTGDVGPELTGMGAFHPPEYFAESILNPNAVITIGQGFTGSDNLSIMPNYNDTLTLRQLIDLVAYLKGLTGGGHHIGHGQQAGHGQHQEDHGQYEDHEQHQEGHRQPQEEHKH